MPPTLPPADSPTEPAAQSAVSDHRPSCCSHGHSHDVHACLHFSDLTLGYESYPAVHKLSGTVDHGALLAIVGPNGSGKSTLLKGVVGLLAPMGGTCAQVDGCRIAYLPQKADIDTSFPATIFDLIKLGLWHKRGLLGRISKADRASIKQALHLVGLDGFEQRTIDTLSGGQLQRALFARVILQDADLILLDEPFNAIDTKTVDDLMGLIHAWHGESRTVVAVVHDLDLVRAHFPQTLLLSREPIAWGATASVLTGPHLQQARQFSAAVRGDAPWCSDHHHHGTQEQAA